MGDKVFLGAFDFSSKHFDIFDLHIIYSLRSCEHLLCLCFLCCLSVVFYSVLNCCLFSLNVILWKSPNYDRLYWAISTYLYFRGLRLCPLLSLLRESPAIFWFRLPFLFSILLKWCKCGNFSKCLMIARNDKE